MLPAAVAFIAPIDWPVVVLVTVPETVIVLLAQGFGGGGVTPPPLSPHPLTINKVLNKKALKK